MTPFEILSVILSVALIFMFAAKFKFRLEDHTKLSSARPDDLEIVRKLLPQSTPVDPVKLNAIAVMIRSNRLIPAIKIIRDVTMLDLKPSKELMEKMKSEFKA